MSWVDFRKDSPSFKKKIHVSLEIAVWVHECSGSGHSGLKDRALGGGRFGGGIEAGDYEDLCEREATGLKSKSSDHQGGLAGSFPLLARLPQSVH